MATEKRADCDLWMWDGAAEYEGMLLKLEESAFSARLRQVKKVTSVTGLGKRVASSTPEAQRQLARRRFLAHLAGTAEGTLFQAHLDSVLASTDSAFDFLVSGRFAELTEKQLDMLRTLSVETAAALLQRDAS
jgi:hypothetical protein